MKRKKPNRSYVPLSPQKLRRRTLAKRRLIWELTLCSNRLLGTLLEAIQLGVSCQSIRSIADNPVRGVGIADSNFAVGPVTLWDSSCSDVLLYYVLRLANAWISPCCGFAQYGSSYDQT